METAAGSPLVGRSAELARLAAMVSRAAEQSPAAVLVSGEAGVGKTRLLREFTEQARGSGARILIGSCVPLGSGELPYAPVIDALRRLVREVGDDTMAALAGPAYTDLAGLIADFRDGGRTSKSPPTSQLVVFGAMLRLLDRLGATTPAVLVLEDLHWADQSTLDLVAYLVRGLSDERVLVVGSYRSAELLERHPLRSVVTELHRSRRVTDLELARFSRTELRQFLSTLTDARVDVQRAFELSDGNAFFAEELLASGVLNPTPSGRPVSQLPRSLRDLILERFELLGDDTRTVLRVAATAGRRVSHHLLATVCAMSGSRLVAALRECVATQTLVTVPEDDTYTFRHALLREAVHQDLLPGERIALHAAIATAISGDEQLGFEEDVTLAAELSYHWYEARAFDRALVAAMRAGDMAMQVRAFQEAELQYLRALDLWPRAADPAGLAGATRDRVLGSTADAARWAGHVERAVELIREALDEVPTTDPARKCELLERLGRYLWEAADTVGSRQAYEEAERLLADQPPSAVTARVIAGRALAEVQAGRYSAGLRTGLEAVETARGTGAKAEEGRALNTLGVALTMVGRIDEGIEALRAALEIAELGDSLEDLYRAYGNLMFSLEKAGRLEESVQVALAGLGRARRSGLQYTRGGGVLANNASAVLTQLGRCDEAVALIAEMVADRPVRETLYPRLTLAEVAVAQGRFDEAESQLREIRKVGSAIKDPQFLGALSACEAERLVWLGLSAEAREVVAAGLEAVGATEHAVVVLRLYGLALRIEADEWLRLSALRAGSSSALDEAAARAADLDAAASQCGGSAMPEEEALRLLCAAERQRCGPDPDPARWTAVAEAWSAFGRVPPAAYARWREAETAVGRRDASRATSAVREAHRLAVELGADPLRSELEALARRARLTLHDEPHARDGQPAGPTDPFGLTRREQEVLDHLAEGHTNRQIALALYISEKTASVHVSNILMKLQVGNRGEAAAVAHRLGLSTRKGE